MNKKESYKKYSFCFFNRNGGVSRNNFFSLNCAYQKGDSNKNVEKNREIAANLFKKKNIVLLNQVHSNKIIKIKNKTNNNMSADAMISSRKDILLGVLTADCAPIIVLGKNNFGIIHAGWRGTTNGIIENSITKFLSEGERIEFLKVVVGPHLKKQSFEVKNDFIEDIKKSVKDSEKFLTRNKERIFFDFSKFIKNKLQKLGILNYDISEEDTFSNPESFFSYRYCTINKIKNCGRQISLVGIKNN
ncbi:MAG: peptidoglycan editing factor PgeF [Pseudomonadota bacterium]|nr:peptidoglycan editing factor PgeF [Pseudomonadota bacterium]